MNQVAVLALLAVVALAAPAGRAQSLSTSDILLLPMPAARDEPQAVAATDITNRPGYDNQPAFTPDGNALLYTSIRGDRQADIYRFDLRTGRTTQVTDTPESEYSPAWLPGNEGFSVVRVEKDGGQRLWRFEADGGAPSPVLEHPSVGYYAWADARTVVLFALGEPPTLQVVDTRTGEARHAVRGVGRSIHRIPGRRAVSYVDKLQDDFWVIKSLDLDSGAQTILAPALGQEDHAWTPDGRLLQGRGSTLYVWDDGLEKWHPLADLAEAGVADLSRIAASPDGRYLALVFTRR